MKQFVIICHIYLKNEEPYHQTHRNNGSYRNGGGPGMQYRYCG